MKEETEVSNIPRVKRNIEARLRRESLPDAPEGYAKDIWLLYDSVNNLDMQINDPKVVKELDNIFLEIEGGRDKALADYLEKKGFLASEKNLRSWWLPSVRNALSSPVKVFYNPSGKCPNKCLICFAKDYRKMELNESVAREAFNQITDLPIFWLNLGGCELAFYPLYFDFAEQAIDKGIFVSTAVSGVGLKREWAEKARNLEIKVKVSLDGPKRINDIQRPDTYEAAIGAIEMFREIGWPVRINMVHTKLNNEEEIVDEIFEIARRHGAIGIDLSVLRPKGAALENDLMIPFEDYKNGKVKRVVERFINHPYIQMHGLKAHVNRNLLTLDKVEPKPCQALGIHGSCGRYSMGVNMDGFIDSCFFLPDEYLPKANVNNPKLFTNPNFILNVWQNDETLAKVREYTRKEPCSNCKKKGIKFARGCPANAFYYGGIDPATFLH